MHIFFEKQIKLVEKTNDAFKDIKRFTPHKKREKIPELIFTNDLKKEKIIEYENICNSLADRFESNNNIPLGISNLILNQR